MSIFVNPTQFNDPSDLDSYPRTFEEDLEKARAARVDFIFYPDVSEIYPEGRDVSIKAGSFSESYEGEHRPGHFDGVVTVVNLLLRAVKPDVAVFGEKDFQQLKVISQMVESLGLDVEIIPAPLLRDGDGLALSSRNVNLSPNEREHAVLISKALFTARNLAISGERDTEALLKSSRDILSQSDKVEVEYLEVIDESTFSSIPLINDSARMIVAAVVGKVRLIDNISLKNGEEEKEINIL